MDFQFSPAQEQLKQKAREYGLKWKPYAPEWDARDHVDNMPEIIQSARSYGFLGMTMPQEYGGQGLTVLDWIVVLEEVCRVSQSWIPCDCIFMTSGPGPSIVMRSDNEAARKKFLPPIVKGEVLNMVAITEPKHGSGMSDMETSAVLEGDSYIINGKKRFISGANVIQLYSTFVRFGDIPGAKGIGAIMVEKGLPGLKFGRAPSFIGLRGIPHGELFFDNCKVPKENLLMPEGQFPRLMEAFNMERMHNAVLSVGFAEAAFDAATAYVQKRQQFGRDIIEFQGIQWKIAEMWTQVQAARYMLYNAAATAVEGKYPKGLETTAAKLFCNDMGARVTQDACYIHGGDGFHRDLPVERLARDNFIMPVAGGTPEILKNMIASFLFPDRKFPQRKS